MDLQQQLVKHVMAQRYTGVKERVQMNPGAPKNPLAFYILINARKKKSTDPKDKIFALSGLFSELEVPFPPPDYSKSVCTIYREATISSISYDKNLYILYHAPSDCRTRELPSWVPDWSEEGWMEDDSRYGLLRSRFKASASVEEPYWRFSDNGTALILRGKIVDSIIFRTDPLPGLELMGRIRDQNPTADAPPASILSFPGDEFMQCNHQAYTTLKTWVEVSQWSNYPTGELTKDAFQRTVVNDNPGCNTDAKKDNSFNSWYDIMCLDELDIAAIALQNQGSENLIPSAPNMREAYLRNVANTTPAAKLISSALRGPGFGFHGHAMAFSRKKCFIYTEKGYFGTAADPLPSSVQPGDIVAIVSGLEMPLLLRPIEGGGYKLLTHAYVHGIMYGEAWPETEDQLEEIVLL